MSDVELFLSIYCGIGGIVVILFAMFIDNFRDENLILEFLKYNPVGWLLAPGTIPGWIVFFCIWLLVKICQFNLKNYIEEREMRRDKKKRDLIIDMVYLLRKLFGDD